jgi:quinol monooxygenase YgiN
MRSILSALVSLALVCVVTCPFAAAADKVAEKSPMVAHNVFFSLKDKSDAARKALVDDCHKLLAPAPGIVFYAAGTLADDMKEMQREVNDRDFDVALHCVFKDKAALAAYMTAPKHLEFIKKHKDTWKKVRVFDSYVSGAPKGKG